MSLTPNLDQRMRYIKQLLEESELYKYGMCDEEIIEMIATTGLKDMIKIIIQLYDMADYKKKEKGITESIKRSLI